MNFLKHILFILLFGACSKEITIDIPEHKSKPVLNCLFTPDSIFKVHLSKSTSIFDAPIAFTQGENLLLYGNYILLDSLVWENEYYVSNITPHSNKYYQIKWETEGKTISTSDYLPEFTAIQSASFHDSVAIDQDGDFYSECTIGFSDDPQQNNFYEVSIWKHYKYNDEYETDEAYVFSSDPVIEAEGLMDYYPTSIIISDKMINGQTCTIKINYYPPYWSTGEFVDSNYKLIINFRSISECYYKYKKTLIVHEYNQESDFWDGMGNPLPMFTNIAGGYGIFAGYAVDIDTITKN